MKKIDFLILAIVCIFVFADTVRVPFLWDDISLIEENPNIRKLNLKPFFTQSYWREFRKTGSPFERPIKPVSPLRLISFQLDYKLWGLRPWGFHITNVLLHMLNIFLVYTLVFLIFNERKIALLSSIIFGVFPMNVETVVYIKNRIDIITTIFLFSSLILFIISDQTRNKILIFLSALCYAFSLLSKETAIVLPLVIIFYLLCCSPNGKFTATKETLDKLIPYIVISVVFLIFQKFVVGSDQIAINEAKKFNFFWQHIFTVFNTVAYYFWLLVFPFKHCAERYLHIPEKIFELNNIISLLVVVVYIFILIFLFKKEKKLAFFVSLILIPLLPVSNIIFLSTRPIAEHRLYSSVIGFAVLISFVMLKMINLKKVVYVIIIFLLVSYSTSSMCRVYEWRSAISFWESTEKTALPNHRTYVNLGIAYLSAERYEEAMEKFIKAEKLMPEEPFALNALGATYISAGQYEKAVGCLLKAISIYPNFDNAHCNLGWAYYNLGEKKKAIEHLKIAKNINPRFALTQIYLGKIYKQENKLEEAEKELRAALEQEFYPWDVHEMLIEIYEQRGMYDKAIEEYKKAISISPLNFSAYNGLGILYVKTKNYSAAEECFKKALEIVPTNRIIKKNYAELVRLMNDLGLSGKK